MFYHHIIYVRPMVDRAKAWAEGKGLTRKNPVHGEDEFRIPTQWNFSHSDKERLSTKTSSKTQLKARPITVLIEYVLLFHHLREDLEFTVWPSGWERNSLGGQCQPHIREVCSVT